MQLYLHSIYIYPLEKKNEMLQNPFLVSHISQSILYVNWVIFLFKNKPGMQQ